MEEFFVLVELICLGDVDNQMLYRGCYSSMEMAHEAWNKLEAEFPEIMLCIIKDNLNSNNQLKIEDN